MSAWPAQGAVPGAHGEQGAEWVVAPMAASSPRKMMGVLALATSPCHVSYAQAGLREHRSKKEKADLVLTLG